MTKDDSAASAASPEKDSPTRRRPARPMNAGEAQPERRSLDEMGTLYAPTSISLDAGAFIDDVCPMYFDTTPEATDVVFGDTNATLRIGLSDTALIKFTVLALHAIRAMLRARHDPDLESELLKVWVQSRPDR